MDLMLEQYVDKYSSFPILFSKDEDCCGCSACFAICPKRAIDMVTNIEGFEYPEIDYEKCIKCYQCLKICPYKTVE